MSGVPQGVLQAVGLGPWAVLAAGWWQDPFTAPLAPGAGLSEHLCAASDMFLVNRRVAFAAPSCYFIAHRP